MTKNVVLPTRLQLTFIQRFLAYSMFFLILYKFLSVDVGLRILGRQMTRCHLVGGMTGVTLIRGQQFVSILSILVLFFLFLVILLAKIELLANIFERLVFWLCSQIDYFFLWRDIFGQLTFPSMILNQFNSFLLFFMHLWSDLP